jgi:hypothetical protein
MKKTLLLSLAIMLLCWSFAFAGNTVVKGEQPEITSIRSASNNQTAIDAAKQATTNLQPVDQKQTSIQKTEPVGKKVTNAVAPNQSTKYHGPATMPNWYSPSLTLDNLLTEGFEGGALPADWTDSPGSSPWLYNAGTYHGPGTTHGGSYAAYFNIWDYSTGTQDDLITPSIDFSAHSGVYLLSFWYWHSSGSDYVQIILDEDGVQTVLLNPVPNTTAWTQVVVPFASTSTNGKIIFRGYSYYGSYNPYIDDVAIDDAPSVGRCCYGDPTAPSCADNSQSECEALSGSWNPLQTCAGAPCPAVLLGDICAAPIPITSFPYNDTKNTALYNNDYNSHGNDIVYQFTIAERRLMDFTLCNTVTGFDTWMGVWADGNCGTTTFVVYNDDSTCPTSSVLSHIASTVLDPGTYYLNVEAYGTTNGEYTLDITSDPAPDAPANDNCDAAEAVVGPYPVTVTGTTIGATVDCPGLLDWNAVWYAIDLPYGANNLTVDYCPTATTIGTVGIVYYNDCTDCNAYNLMTYTWPTCESGLVEPLLKANNIPGPATIYFPAYPGEAMDFGMIVDVQEYVPCVVECPPEGVPEGEPICGDEYDDTYNGGCNSTVPIFQDIFDGDVICGTSGTFLFGGANYRETDWFQLIVDDLKTINWTCTAEFPVYLFILDGNNGCAGLTQLTGASAAECVPLTVSATVTAGTYWLWVGPSVFTGIACGADYVASLTLTTPPPPPYNDLCENAIIQPLVAGTPLTFNGDNTNALAIGDCASFSSYPNVWEGFTTTECLDITVDYCGTTPAWGDIWLGLAIDCPCTGTIAYASFENTTCPDGNYTVLFRHVPAGTYYYPVMVDPAYGSVGPYTLNVNGTACPPPPANDLCSGAIQLTSLPASEVGSTADATIDSEFPTCTTTISSAGVWYSVQGTGNTMTASTCNAYTTYDSKINVYCYSCETPICVGGNDDNCVDYGLRSSIDWCSDPTATYLILVQGYGSAVGDFQLDVTDDGVPCTGAVVCGVPIFGVTPPEVSGQALVGGTDSEVLTISNTGDAQLDGTAYVTIQAPSPLRTLPPSPIDTKAAISAPPTPLKVSVPMPPKNQRVILQGGDNCADAFDLGNTEPVSDAGTTTGYAHDAGPLAAQPACWQGSWYAVSGDAPDVFYTWTAPYDSIYTISCCGSGYDQSLLIYSNTCPDLPTDADFICGNDDGAACGDLTSEVASLPLLAGQQILIVVSGYDGAAGDYTLNISAVVPPPPPPGCPDGSIVSLNPTLPTEGWTFATSDAEPGYTAYESFVGLSAEITEVKFWAIQAYNDGSAWSNCSEDPASLQINFYADNSGVPGAVLQTYDVSVSPVVTGQSFSGFTQVEFDVTLPTPITVFAGWISIQGTSAGDNCWFLWQNSFGGDNMSLQSDGSGTFTVGAYDLAMCLIGTTFTPWLTVDPTSFSVAPGFTTPMNVGMNGAGFAVGTYYGSIVITTNEPTLAVHTVPVTFQITGGPSGCNYHIGDANNSQVFNGLDVTYSVGYFKGGALPPYSCECTPGHTWFVAGDVNASCSFNGLDVTYMVSYFKGGPMVHGCPDCLPAGGILLAPGTPVINAPVQNGAGQ